MIIQVEFVRLFWLKVPMHVCKIHLKIMMKLDESKNEHFYWSADWQVPTCEVCVSKSCLRYQVMGHNNNESKHNKEEKQGTLQAHFTL